MIEEREKKIKKEKEKVRKSQQRPREERVREMRVKGKENTSVQLEESAVYLSMRKMRVSCVCV